MNPVDAKNSVVHFSLTPVRVAWAAPLLLSGVFASSQASAQVADLCTGLRANVPVLQPVVGGFLDPLLNGLVSGINTNLVGALSGQTLDIGLVDGSGHLVSVGNCNVATDTVTVKANRGISLGGGRIDGLGGTNNPAAVAGEVNSIALGNGAATSATALNAVALGLRGSVSATDGVALGRDTVVGSAGGVALGAGSVASRGGLAGGAEAFSGVGVASTAGAVSIGSAGNERQLTNVAGGTQDTDAVNLRQLRAVGANVANSFGGGAAFDASSGAFTAPTFLINGVAYYDVATALAAAQAGPGFYVPVGANNTSRYAGPVVTGSDAIGVGYGSTASGNRAVAFGTSATASADRTTAMGADSMAAATGATAVGQGATAAHDNATAIGANARTTRANQVAVGNAQSTYTMSGVTSAQSANAQRGPTRLLTTDSAGNIAASNIDINGMDRRISSLEADSQMNRRGIAAAMAMNTASMPSAPGRTSWTVNAATFRSEYAAGFAFAHRFNTAQPLAVTGSYGNGGGSAHGGRIGLAGEF